MATDTQAAAEFYATPRGAVAALLVRERLQAMWPQPEGLSVLGIGYAAPPICGCGASGRSAASL